jgi:hypothetical protein
LILKLTMPFATSPAYIQYVQGWEPRIREHPVIDWMFDYEEAFDFGDMKSGPHAPWHADDFVYVKSGEASGAGAPSWAKLISDYAPFASHYHEPRYFIVYETATGFELMGWANIFGNFLVPGEKNKADLKGRKWEMMAPGAFHFIFEKDASGPKGLKLKKQELFADGIPLVGELVKRGMVTWEEAAQQ